jgi:hypothetical protein
MKVALLISGLYKNATVPIENLLAWLRSHEGYEVDVYLHAWWDPSYVGKRHRHDYLSIVEPDPTNDIVEKIKPIDFKLEPQAKMDVSGLPFRSAAGGEPVLREITYFSFLSQMESLRRCFHLVKNPNQYDMILRMRGDLFVEDVNYRIPIKKEELKDGIYIADGQYFTGWPYGDWAYFGSPMTMALFIENQIEAFKFLCKSFGHCPHIHDFITRICVMVGAQPIRWFVPLKITRLNPEQHQHILMDTVNTTPGLPPFFWDCIDQERCAVPND